MRLQKGLDLIVQNFSYRRLLCVSFPTFFTGKYFLRILLANLSIFFSQCNFHWLPPLAACLKQPVFSIPNLMSLNAILHELFSFLISQLGRLFAAFLMKWCILFFWDFSRAIGIRNANKLDIIFGVHITNLIYRRFFGHHWRFPFLGTWKTAQTDKQ